MVEFTLVLGTAQVTQHMFRIEHISEGWCWPGEGNWKQQGNQSKGFTDLEMARLHMK